jgi:hypothetical protein
MQQAHAARVDADMLCCAERPTVSPALVQVLTPMRLQPSTFLCSLNPMAPTAAGEQRPCSLTAATAAGRRVYQHCVAVLDCMLGCLR